MTQWTTAQHLLVHSCGFEIDVFNRKDNRENSNGSLAGRLYRVDHPGPLPQGPSFTTEFKNVAITSS